MKTLELQVADALQDVLSAAAALRVAPRIAAAIRAMGYHVTAKYTDDLPLAVGSADVAEGEAAALAALRAAT